MECAYHDAGTCRSCTELLVPYAAQLDAKLAHARTVLAAHEHEHVRWLPPVASVERGFRNRAKMVVGGTVQAPRLGIPDPSGGVEDLTHCALYPESLQDCFPAIARFIARAKIAPYDIATRRGELKLVLLTQSNAGGELMLRFVCRSQEPVARLRKHLASLLAELPQLAVVTANVQPVHAAVLEGEHEIVLGERGRIAMDVGGVRLFIAPKSFFQTNTDVAAALYAQARDWVDGAAPATVWDLYCGVGGFALHCARAGRRVVGVERAPDAIACASESRVLAGLAESDVDLVVADSEAWARVQCGAPDLVIVNPPRRGIGTLAQWLQESSVPHVVYSSCNVESLATDLARMPAFVLREARVLDMFPHTKHYEVIARLDRRSSCS